MKPKTYKIQTLSDILDVVNPDNIECFKKDFSEWLNHRVFIKQAINEINKNAGVNVEVPNEFTWIDDGKNNADIIIKVVNQKL
jgi:hypothetical protein